MISCFLQISQESYTELFLCDCDSTIVYESFWPLLDFDITTVPHLHEYWSFRIDRDIPLYLIKSKFHWNLLFQ